MANKRKIPCPKCGGQLLFGVKAESSLSRKINKDGTLSKVIHQGTRHLTDVYYLQCDEYRCDFLYHLSYPSMNKETIDYLEEWYDEQGECFE